MGVCGIALVFIEWVRGAGEGNKGGEAGSDGILANPTLSIRKLAPGFATL